jgi:ankyrin repeat protein
MEYLLKKGVSTSASNSNGDYPIHAAVRQNSFMMVEALINNGADLSTTTSNGYTPRKLAKKLKYKSLKKYLKKVEKSK